MEDKFYLGIVHRYNRITGNENIESLVLYSDDNVNYLSLDDLIWYSTNKGCREYVEEESIISTDINEYKINYEYILSSIKEGKCIKKKNNFFNK